jgi:hypothetical protein
MNSSVTWLMIWLRLTCQMLALSLLIQPQVAILDFFACNLLVLNLTTYFGTNLKEHFSDGLYEQLSFKYFPILHMSF